ncbi:peptidase inhibitor family I36 protein [Streptomyces sp. NPDC021356]|uniref:peptidase inhibitor family I36 protein n=1 Tax=Streptomyces sp. NPDC021356 TaxID=3154900 RepID=UPI0033F0D0F3
MKLRNKRLAGIGLTVLAAGATVLGASTAASASAANEPWQVGVWNVGSDCNAAKYEFCVCTDANYQGKSVGIRWGERDTYLDISADIGASMNNSISSVINNTNYAWAMTDVPKTDGCVDLRVHSYHHLANLADFGFNDRASGLTIWKDAGPGA